MAKRILAVFVALFVALGAGWLWGASGRWDAERGAQAVQLRSDLFQAKSLVLAARVDVYSMNFGDASRHLEDAKASLNRASNQLKAANRADEMARVGSALARIGEAQQMAGRLDQSANSRAADAARAIDEELSVVLRD